MGGPWAVLGADWLRVVKQSQWWQAGGLSPPVKSISINVETQYYQMSSPPRPPALTLRQKIIPDSHLVT